jgi:hypothetical protein
VCYSSIAAHAAPPCELYRVGLARPRLSVGGLLFALLLTGCSSAQVVRPVDQPASMTPWIPLVEWYEAHQGPEDCPPDKLVSDVVQGAIGIEEARLSCLLDLARARELAGVDASVSAGHLGQARARVETLEGQRWWFLGGGVAAGVVGTLLLVLAR